MQPGGTVQKPLPKISSPPTINIYSVIKFLDMQFRMLGRILETIYDKLLYLGLMGVDQHIIWFQQKIIIQVSEGLLTPGHGDRCQALTFQMELF